jgi:hypothetical protein
MCSKAIGSDRQRATPQITFSTIDKRKCPLRGEIWITQTSKETMVHFKKTKVSHFKFPSAQNGADVFESKGDPLEARRFFRLCHKDFRNFAPEDQDGDGMDLS